ncbi:hypothetical protein ACWOA4_09260 [Pediococcus pentosaceus]|uniref:hypothetical protein n=1 Tax=Pediococcus pentosaceus TaxID=1255 RepID=UPI00190F7E8E|nr:hypothetical protein [Pediococcus pentosaceus]
MKYSEAEKKIRELSSKYSVEFNNIFDCLNVNYKGTEIAYISTGRPYSVRVRVEDYFKKLPFSNKLYMIMAELAITPLDERAEEKKKYVKVYDSRVGYLNINNFTGKMSVSDVFEGNGIKTKFTDKEIEEFKQRDDIPLDWNKVRFEEVEDES